MQKNVLAESQEHNDLVVEDFHDVYLNLTIKTGFLLKWLSQDCPEAKFVLKVRVLLLSFLHLTFSSYNAPILPAKYCQQRSFFYLVSHM